MYLLYIVAVIIILIISYKVFEKLNFNLNKLEIVFFQLSFLICFHIGNYYNYEYKNYYFGNFFFLGLLIFIILLFYYILNIIKTKKYIQLSTIILYIIIFIIDYCSLDFIEFKDWDKLGYGIAFFAEVGIILIFMMLLNFILFIIKKQKKLKINSRVKNIFINKKVEISIIILIIVFPYIYGFVGNKLYSRFEKQRIDKVSKIAINYIIENYEITDVVIKEIEEDGGCYFILGCSTKVYNVRLESNYLENDLVIEINRVTYEIENKEYIKEQLN